jgi:hypothetical protein
VPHYKETVLLYHTNCYFYETAILIKLTTKCAKPRLLLDLFGAGGRTNHVLQVHYVRQVPATTPMRVLRWKVDTAARYGGQL